MAKKEMNLGGLLNSVTSRVEDAMNSNDVVKTDVDNTENADTNQQSNVVTQQLSNATTQKRQKKVVPRSNGCTYYLEDAHIDAIDRIKCFNKLDKQDVVRTAVDLFLASYMKPDGMGLNYEGVEEVNKYIYQE